MHRDGLADAGDIDYVAGAVRAGSADWRFNLNHDTAVSRADVEYLVRTLLNTQMGDANLSGQVNEADRAVLTANYGHTGGWGQGKTYKREKKSSHADYGEEEGETGDIDQEDDNFVNRVSFKGPFPEKSSFVIEVPKDLKDDAGRAFIK